MNMTPEEYSAASKLYEENQGLPIWVVNTYFPQYKGDEDVYQEARLGLWRACCYYNASKTKFSTFATTCIRNEVIRPFRSAKRHNGDIVEISMNTIVTSGESLDSNITLEDVIADPVDYINGADIALRDFIAQLSERDREIVLLKCKGYTFDEMSPKIGCSKQACGKRLRNLKKKYFELDN